MVIIFNAFLQLKSISESQDVKDNLTIGSHSIMKPIFGSSAICEISDGEMLVALRSGDTCLSTHLGELNGTVRNHKSIHPLYTNAFNDIAPPNKNGVRFDNKTGYFHGSININSPDLF